MQLFSLWNYLFHPFVGLGVVGSHSSDSSSTPRPAGESAPEVDGMRRSGLVKTEAEDLLDWLEANGCAKYEISSMSGNTFAVRWWN